MLRVMRRFLQNCLKRLGVYHRLKASALYTFYWAVIDRSVVDRVRVEVDFYRNLLQGFRQGDLIFDVGANHGHKTAVFLRLGASVLAVEPDEACKAVLEEMFLRYRLTPKPVVIVDKAVSDTTTTQTLWIEEPGSAKNTLNRKWVDTLRSDDKRFGQRLSFSRHRDVVTTTLDALVKAYGTPLFIKIDVEGHEPLVLEGLKKPVPYLSFEVNLPEFRQEGVRCVELLERLAPHGQFNYLVDCRNGMAQKEWVGPREFSRVLGLCTETSIEVFWRTVGTGLPVGLPDDAIQTDVTTPATR